MNYLRFCCCFILISVSLQSLPYKYIPKMVVFDGDYTLWPFWVDIHMIAPFHKENGTVVDKRGNKAQCYPEVPTVLKYLKDNNIKIGLYAKTFDKNATDELLDLFEIRHFIDSKTILPVETDPDRLFDEKIIHQYLLELGHQTRIDLKDMLFFDDVYKIHLIYKSLKVVSCIVDKGINMIALKKGLQKYSDFWESPEIKAAAKNNHTNHTDNKTKI